MGTRTLPNTWTKSRRDYSKICGCYRMLQAFKLPTFPKIVYNSKKNLLKLMKLIPTRGILPNSRTNKSNPIMNLKTLKVNRATATMSQERTWTPRSRKRPLPKRTLKRPWRSMRPSLRKNLQPKKPQQLWQQPRHNSFDQNSEKKIVFCTTIPNQTLQLIFFLLLASYLCNF